MRISNYLLALVASSLLELNGVHAAVIPTMANSSVETFFDGNISTTDLIQAGSSTLSGTVIASRPGAFSETGSNNGDAVHTSGLSYWGGGADVDLTYNLTGSLTGYDITSVNSIYGWQDSRYRHAAQEWTLLVSTVSNPSFTPLSTVVYAPFVANDIAAGSTQVNLTDSLGILASGVTAIRFHLLPYGVSGDPGYSGEYGVVREFDVFGSATVPPVPAPEPSSLALLGIAVVGATVVRRKKQSTFR